MTRARCVLRKWDLMLFLLSTFCLSKMRVLLSLLHSPYTRLCWQLAAEPQTTATAVLLHAGMTLKMKDRHRRVSFAGADSARGRLGEGQGAWRRMQRGASACRNGA